MVAADEQLAVVGEPQLAAGDRDAAGAEADAAALDAVRISLTHDPRDEPPPPHY